MVFPGYGIGGAYGGGAEVGGPAGDTYAAVVVRVDDEPSARHDVLAALRQIRFSGWLAPPEGGWLVAVAEPAAGSVAAGRRGVVGVGEWLAARLARTVLVVRVLADRQLVLAAWADGDELGRYVSDPSREPGADDDVLSEPLGAKQAAAFAAACGRPEQAGDLAEILAESLDTDSVIESERLARLLRLLGLPTWLVAAATLPHDIPTGPRVRSMTRLGAGLPGVLGRVRGWAANVVRRRRPPPPVITDPPRTSPGVDPWLL
jgi:hypothetical protein